jgi:hypothetical protein
MDNTYEEATKRMSGTIKRAYMDDDDIEVVEIIEKDDGSAVMTVALGKEALRRLVEYSILELLKNLIKETEDVKRCDNA